MSRKQDFVNVLNSLELHELDAVKGLLEVMPQTTLEPYRTNVEKAIDFYLKAGHWPALGLINQGLDKIVPEPHKQGTDFLTQLCFELQEESFQVLALCAANEGDWEGLENLVFKKSLTMAKKFVPYVSGDAFAEYENMEKSASGIFLGVIELDEVLRGIPFKASSVLAAPPSMFKTSAAISAAFHNAYYLGFNVLYVTLEVPKRNIWFQILSRLSVEKEEGKSKLGSRLVSEEIIKVLLDSEGKKRFKYLQNQWDTKAKGSLHVADQSDLGDGSYKSLLSMLNSVNEHVANDIDIVIWDYVQLFKFFKSPKQTEAEYLNGLVRYTDSLCKSYRKKGFVNILLSQVNRQGQLKIARKNCADLTLLAEVNELERSANSVIVLYSDEGMRLNNQLKAQIVKHRDGRVMEEMATLYVDPEVSMVGTGTDEKYELSVSSLDLLGEDPEDQSSFFA